MAFQIVGLEFIITSEVSCWSFVVVYKICSDVSDLCHEIAINGYYEHLHLTIWLYVAITE